eukprot:scaffold5173_cov125-Isochrysis_galbana.AAC.3
MTCSHLARWRLVYQHAALHNSQAVHTCTAPSRYRRVARARVVSYGSAQEQGARQGHWGRTRPGTSSPHRRTATREREGAVTSD